MGKPTAKTVLNSSVLFTVDLFSTSCANHRDVNNHSIFQKQKKYAKPMRSDKPNRHYPNLVVSSYAMEISLQLKKVSKIKYMSFTRELVSSLCSATVCKKRPYHEPEVISSLFYGPVVNYGTI